MYLRSCHPLWSSHQRQSRWRRQSSSEEIVSRNYAASGKGPLCSGASQFAAGCAAAQLSIDKRMSCTASDAALSILRAHYEMQVNLLFTLTPSNVKDPRPPAVSFMACARAPPARSREKARSAWLISLAKNLDPLDSGVSMLSADGQSFTWFGKCQEVVLKWGLDRLSRPCFVQYNIDIEYFSTVISESAVAKRVEILRWSAYRCSSLQAQKTG